MGPTSNMQTRPRVASSDSSALPNPSRPTVDAKETSKLIPTRQADAVASRALLLVWDDLPAWRRDNAFILSGYRPESASIRQSFASVFGLHNESVNIWTHLLGAICFPMVGLYLYAVIAPRYATATRADIVVFACFFAGAAVCLGMSATYHALSNHSHRVARLGNKLDYSGIICLIVGSFVPTLYYGFSCMNGLLTKYLTLTCTLGLVCLAASWDDRFRQPLWRPYRALMFVGLGVSGVVPILHSFWFYDYAELRDRTALPWVLLQGALYIFGAVIYAARWPERMKPGNFDIWASSHQIFHILILFAAAAHLNGMSKAFDYHHGITGMECFKTTS